MDWSCRLLFVLGMILVASLGFLDKREEEGKALLDRAKQAADIRADGAPAFHLKTSFKVIKGDSTVTEGVYTETWVSQGQWRRETVLGDFRGIVVSNGKKRWILNNTSAVPTGTDEVGIQMAPLRFSPEFWKPEKIQDREIRSFAVRCIETKPDPIGGKSALCFEKSTGTLVVLILPLEVQDRIVDKTCEYRDYQEFGGKVFPRLIRCFEGRELRFEETVLELSAKPPLDPALFAPLAGGTESVNCLGVSKPASSVHRPDPALSGVGKFNKSVTLQVTVETDGKPYDLRVVRSADEAFDNAAMEAVRRWRFKPATCDGEPIASKIDVTIRSRLF